jgi:hypothetical protein
VIPPYPYSITEDIADVPFKDCWYARPQLFFQCYLRPTGGLGCGTLAVASHTWVI